MHNDIQLYNSLEAAKRKKPLGEYVSLTGLPSNGKFHALDGSSLLRSEYPELDKVYPDTQFAVNHLTSDMLTNQSWTYCAYGNGIYVAIPSSGNTYATSSDGMVWESHTLPVSVAWGCIGFGNGIFVLVAYASTACYTSPDGINWTSQSLPTFKNWNGIVYEAGMFIVIAYGSATYVTSVDGENWSSASLPISSTWMSITNGNGIILITSTGTDSLTSTDGTNWVYTLLPVSSIWGVCFGDGIFVGVRYWGNECISSVDGINWSVSYSLPLAERWIEVAYGSGVYIAMVYNTAVFAYSIDGINWTALDVPYHRWSDITYGSNDTFVAVSEQSSNGEFLQIQHADTHIELPNIPNKYIQVKS